MLLSAAQSPGSLVPSIKYVNLPNEKRGPAEHYFVNNRERLIDTIASWLKEQKL
jgi:hypothetical protein